MIEKAVFGAIAFAAGAITGSFLNVCVHRLPKRESLVRPASHCPNCQKPIPWHDNIPIVSFFALMGRCRFCRARISPRYVIVEVLTACLFTALFITFGLTAKFFAMAILAAALIVATFVDFEIQEIPDEVSIGGLALGLALSAAFPGLLNASSFHAGLFNSAAGAFAGGASIYLMGFFGELVFRKEAMGGGDVKLMAMIGSFLGWRLTLLVFFMAPLFGSVVGIILTIKEGRRIIPYGPYLSLAAMISVFRGEEILGLFFRRFF